MKRLLFFVFIAVTTLSTAGAQTSRELKTESNGFRWYQTHSGNYYGAESTDGRTIVPLSKGYTMIVFHEKSNCIGYFGVHKNGKKGAYDIHGNLVIEPIHEKLYYLSKGFSYEDAYGTDHYLGITLDANGRASSASGSSSYTPSSSSSYGTQQGNKELQTERNGFRWYKTSSGSYQGAESIDGRTIAPLSKGYTMIVFHEKSNCIGYFAVHKNGKKGAYDIHGNLVIEPIHEKLYYLSEGFSYEDTYGTDHYLGITLDANGRASSYGHTGSTSLTTRSASSAYNNSYQQPQQQQTQQKSTQIDVLYSACYDENMKPLPKGKGDSPIEYIARFIFNADQIVIKVVKVERALNSKETIITETKFDPKKCNYKELGNEIEISDVLTDLTVNPSKNIIVLRNRYENVLLSGYAFGPLDDENLEFLIMLNEYTSATELALEEQYNGNLSKKVKEVVSHLKKYSYKNR